MTEKMDVSIFWFRRDLRFYDNCGLFHALKSNYPVIPLFIFDEEILADLPKNDPRVTFIYESLENMNLILGEINSSLLIEKGNIYTVWERLIKQYSIKKVFYNKDYEPYARERDNEITAFLNSKKIDVYSFKDQVIFEENEILKQDGNAYTVFTPYKNKWRLQFDVKNLEKFNSLSLISKFLKMKFEFPSLNKIGFFKSNIKVKLFNSDAISDYDKIRDMPSMETSNASVYLRFGLISVRELFKNSLKENQIYCDELIWREFFMQILYHFPKVVHHNFNSKYDFIPWRNNEKEFKLWCEGKTGYPIVDAGMRELNETGYMQNRVRMIVASFLNKHLLIDWRWGEAYFASKLMDYELSSNNGNWQWVAGTGCDSAPYFRVFNPTTQQLKFDPDFKYIKKWIPDFENYKVKEIVDHKFARARYLESVKGSLKQLSFK